MVPIPAQGAAFKRPHAREDEMADDNKPTGPDLTKGVSLSDIADGGMLVGHVGGDEVLLARRGAEVFAVGAHCTHYHGPLAEGLLVEDTVRCPWHHACFSLRTGEPVGAPALNPVACWRVERSGDRVRVAGKTDRDPLAPSEEVKRGVTRTRAKAHAAHVIAPPTRAPENIVIVGAGAAGTAAGEMLRRLGYTGRLTILDAEPDSPYDRPNLSKDYLAGNAPEEWIPIRPEGFYAEHRIDIVRGRATRLDVAGRRLELEGRLLSFDALILATGAEPVRLTNVPGHDLPRVHYLRTLRDSRAIIGAADSAKHAVVIGASFIGLEVAASLRTRRGDLEVHVVAS